MFNKENSQVAEKGNARKIKNDIFFIAILLSVIAVAACLLLVFRKEGNMVKVTVDGEVYGMYSLAKDIEVEIKTENGYNILVIENGKAYVKDASCPDGICSSHRPIKHTGASIICLPNKVVVSIENNENGGQTDNEFDII